MSCYSFATSLCRGLGLAVVLSGFALSASAAPPTPSQGVPVCDANVAGRCYVDGPFQVTTTSAGAHHFKVCRSNDTSGWGGCAVTLTTNTQMPYTVGSADIASDGKRRAYYFSACDASNSCTPWSANPEVYVYTDTTAPTAAGTSTVTNCAVGATGPSGCWVTGNFTYTATPGSDGGSGVASYRACRSNDSTGGHAGCNVTMGYPTSPSFTVTGSHLPAEGFRRAYRFRTQDAVGLSAPWNNPVYVRVDYRDPWVSADNASSSWVTSQTATISAGDDVGGSQANSGLKEVRYRWNAGLNAACTNGTVTASGATLNVPDGDNTLYLCARDFTGRVGSWQGTYRVDGTNPSHASLTTDSVWVIDDGSEYDVNIQVDEAHSGLREIRSIINLSGTNKANPRGQFSWRDGSLSYQWSADQVPCTGGGFASKHPTNYNPATVTLVGCNTSVSGNRRTVTFKVRPNASFGEFAGINDISAWAQDFALNKALWKLYNLDFRSRLADDGPAPTLESLTVSSSSWVVNRAHDYDIVATAKDLGSGVREIRSLINLNGSNSANRGGFFSWRDQSAGYAWTKDQMPCTGGGWASMHPTDHGATRSTLVGCDTSLIQGVERRVTFTVRPNETFGVFPAINDISMRAWDFGNNKPNWTNFDTNFSTSRPVDHKAQMFGYQGILDAAGLAQSQAQGVPVDVASLLYLRKRYVCDDACRTDPSQCVDSPAYWENVDTAGILGAYSASNAKAMLILENVLFRNMNDPVGDDCQDDPQPFVATGCFSNQNWRLRSDWQQRLDDFVALHGAHITPQNIAFILITSEINDRCFSMGEVQMVAQAVRAKLPGIPLAMIYGASYNKDGVRISQPAPGFFPSIFDIVGLFSYDNYDVNNPLEARNAADGNYYNPENPTDPSTIYGDLLNKLHPHQQVLLVFDAQSSGTQSALGWVPEDLGMVLLNYAEFMSYRPEITIMGGFTWQGLMNLPASVRATSTTVACQYVHNDSPLCP